MVFFTTTDEASGVFRRSGVIVSGEPRIREFEALGAGAGRCTAGETGESVEPQALSVRATARATALLQIGRARMELILRVGPACDFPRTP
jgi:hypothetical protein